MNSSAYLQSYGWKEGTALKSGGLKKPILVAHKKDTKGLGHGAQEHEAWWERVFDGQLKSLNVESSEDGSSVKFKQDEVKVSGVSQHLSPLYRMFVRGGLLCGTLETSDSNSKADEEHKTKKAKKTKDSENDKDASRKKSSKVKKKSSKDSKKLKKSSKSDKSRAKSKDKVKQDFEDKIRRDKKKEKKDRKGKKSKRVKENGSKKHVDKETGKSQARKSSKRKEKKS